MLENDAPPLNTRIIYAQGGLKQILSGSLGSGSRVFKYLFSDRKYINPTPIADILTEHQPPFLIYIEQLYVVHRRLLRSCKDVSIVKV